MNAQSASGTVAAAVLHGQPRWQMEPGDAGPAIVMITFLVVCLVVLVIGELMLHNLRSKDCSDDLW